MHPTAAPSHPLVRFRERYALGLERLVILLMVVLAGEVVLGVFMRAIGRPLVWYDEMASVLLAWLTFYGSALASARRAHIGCPELVDQLSAGPRRALALVSQIMVIAFFALVGWVGADILPVLADEMLVSVPWLSAAMVQSVIPVSAALILVAEFLNLIDLIRAQPADRTASSLADGLH
ncbi:MAG: TRAP transporter small permease [Burkholderiaceae bacterium]|jgi:TRAP-type transport system small permease protein